jgi:hypothetical protein
MVNEVRLVEVFHTVPLAMGEDLSHLYLAKKIKRAQLGL